MEIKTMSRGQAEQITTSTFDPSKSIGIISIGAPEQNPPSRLDEDVFDGILRLYFHDTEQANKGQSVMNDLDAQDVITFLKNHNFDLLIIHCQAGISRSCGLAYALESVLNDGKLRNNWVNYNRHVYNVMRRNLTNRRKDQDYYNKLFGGN